MSADVRDFLRRGAGDPQPSWGFDGVWQRSRRHRARRAALVAAGTIVIAALSVGVAKISTTNEGEGRRKGAMPAAKGQWERIPKAPIQGRVRNVAVWTGGEMIVWGGQSMHPDNPAESVDQVDGAAFDPVNRSWRRITEGPLEVSRSRTAVWTGREMLLWGGEIGNGSDARPDNGASYEPGKDSWTELPRSPFWSQASHSAVWTGTEMIVWGGVGMESLGAAYDPRSRAWRKIATAPIDGRHRHVTVWTGTEMIVWGGLNVEGQALATGGAYDPDSDSWRRLPPSVISGRDLHEGFWSGEEMVVVGGTDEQERFSRAAAAYRPASDSWRELARVPVRVFNSGEEVVTGDSVVVVGIEGSLAAYSMDENDWTRLPQPPFGPVQIPTLLSIEDGLILWGGYSGMKEEDVRLPNEGAVLRLHE